jgi:hypothetical protein
MLFVGPLFLQYREVIKVLRFLTSWLWEKKVFEYLDKKKYPTLEE